jgi:pimeloyl-ACP methyl ester carboxylesterase
MIFRSIGVALIGAVMALPHLGEHLFGPSRAPVFPRAVQDWRMRGDTVLFHHPRDDPLSQHTHALFAVASTVRGRDAPPDAADRSRACGSALLVLHGFPSSSFDWAHMWADLRALGVGTGKFDTVVTFDFLGFGLSDKPRPFRYDIATQADAAEAVLAHYGCDGDVHILAHDYGDTVAQELVARHHSRTGGSLVVPARIASVAMLNGGLYADTHRPVLMQRLLLIPGLGSVLARLTVYPLFARAFSRVFGAATQPSTETLHAQWSLIRHADGHHISPLLLGYIEDRRVHAVRFSLALETTEDAVPKCYIYGPEDPVSGEHMAQRFARGLPGADLRPLPGIGHYPQIEDREATLAELTGFWRSF